MTKYELMPFFSERPCALLSAWRTSFWHNYLDKLKCLKQQTLAKRELKIVQSNQSEKDPDLSKQGKQCTLKNNLLPKQQRILSSLIF